MLVGGEMCEVEEGVEQRVFSREIWGGERGRRGKKLEKARGHRRGLVVTPYARMRCEHTQKNTCAHLLSFYVLGFPREM